MPTERACGQRSTGCYIEVGLSEHGLPVEWFILDPSVSPVVFGFSENPARELANKKSQLYLDTNGIYHVIDWVGGDYTYVSDFIEEGRAMGFSRKLPPNFPFEKLTAGVSTMLCIHPHCYNDLWDEQSLPSCKSYDEASKHPKNVWWQEIAERVKGHPIWDRVVPEEGQELLLSPQDGPCTWKAYQLVPKEAGTRVDYETYERKLGKTQFGTTYQYHPTGEDTSGLRTGFFARLPIPIITFVDGNMQDKERAQWEKNREKAADAGFTVKSIHMEHDASLGIDVEVLDDLKEKE